MPETHDRTIYVKVVPDELVKQYSERGWEKTSTSSKTSSATRTRTKKTAAKKTATKPAE